MKQAVIVVGLVLLLSFIISGGFSVKNSEEPIPSPDPVIGDLIGEGDPSANDKALQLRNLKFTNRSPLPSTAPSTQPSASPSCQGEKVAVDLLLDVSFSMCEPLVPGLGCSPTPTTKINQMKDAVIQFANLLKPNDVIGVQIFSDNAINIFSPDLYSNYQTTFQSRITSLQPLRTTAMRRGFELAKQEITQAQTRYPDYNWVLIFLTDGIPTGTDGLGPYEPENPTAVALEIESQDVRIITIGLDLNSLLTPGIVYTIPRSQIIAYARNLLTQIASSPADYHESPSGSDLLAIYQDIAENLCLGT